MKEVIAITGAKGAGKTTLAVRYARPSEVERMLVIDTEDSTVDIWNKTAAALDGRTFDVVRFYDRFPVDEDMLERMAQGKLPWVDRSKRNSLIDVWEWLIEELDRVATPGKYKYLVIDTVEPLEAAMTAWVEYKKKDAGWSGQRAYGRMETEGVRPLYENFFEAMSRRGIETILLTSHLKRPWINDRPVVNKVKPGGRIKVLSRISKMMLWLFSYPNQGAPAAVVLKARDIGSRADTSDDEWDDRRMLPHRIPVATWREIRRYQREGCDLENPAEGEAMTDAERQTITEMLSDEQLRLMVADAEVQAEIARQAAMISTIPTNDSDMQEDELVPFVEDSETTIAVAKMLADAKQNDAAAPTAMTLVAQFDDITSVPEALRTLAKAKERNERLS